jgi:hypothetical protein
VTRAVWLVLLAACDSKTFGGTPPNGFCPTNNIRDPGPGCSVPVADVVVDGDPAEWADVPVVDCPECADGTAAQLRALRTPDGRLAMFVGARGAPMIDAGHSYLLELAPLREPSYWIDIFVQPNEPPDIQLDGLPITGWPVDVAFGATGIELAMPTAMLPYQGAVNGYGVLGTIDSTGAWTAAQPTSAFVTACWDPASPICAPL